MLETAVARFDLPGLDKLCETGYIGFMKKGFFRLAARAARCSTMNNPTGCVVVRKNRVVSFGFNSRKSHPKSPIPRWFCIHAELSACMGIPADKLHGSDVYVVRLTKTGKYAMSKPCPFCETMLRGAKVRRAFYTTRERDFKTEVYV